MSVTLNKNKFILSYITQKKINTIFIILNYTITKKKNIYIILNLRRVIN